MPQGATSLQPFTPTQYTSQVASTYKANIDGNSSILSNPGGSLYVYPNNPAGLSVLVDPAFSLLSLLGAGTNGGPYWLNSGGSPITVSLTVPGTNSYYATIYWNPLTNGPGVVYGASGTSPFPILPDDLAMIPLAVVLLTTGQSQVQASNITDVRLWWSFGPVRYFNQTVNANATINCAGATSVSLNIDVTTSGFTLTLSNLRVGALFQMLQKSGTPSVTIQPVTPSGINYAMKTKAPGSNSNFTNANPFSSGAGTSILYLALGVYDAAANGTPSLLMAYL